MVIYPNFSKTFSRSFMLYVLIGSFLHFKGKAKIEWKQSRTHYSDKEVLLDQKVFFMGGGKAELIPAGSHSFNFEFELPLNLPESFTSSNAEIQYEVKVVNEIPWGFNEEVCASFIVERRNNLPALKMPFKIEKMQRFFSLNIFSSFKMSATLANGNEYAAGSEIPIEIEYDSGVVIKRTKIKLKRFIIYGASYIYQKQLEKETISKVIKEGDSNFMTTSLTLPSNMLKSNGGFCKDAIIEYVLVVEPMFDSVLPNPKIEIPIAIGEKYFERKRFKHYTLTCVIILIILLIFSYCLHRAFGEPKCIFGNICI